MRLAGYNGIVRYPAVVLEVSFVFDKTSQITGMYIMLLLYINCRPSAMQCMSIYVTYLRRKLITFHILPL